MRYRGTTWMIERMITDRLFLDPEEYSDAKAPPVTNKQGVFYRNKNNQLYKKVPNWLRDVNTGYQIVMVMSENPDASLFIAKNKKTTHSRRFKTTINIVNMPHRDTEGDLLNVAIDLVDVGGHVLMWELGMAGEWINRVVTPEPYLVLSVLMPNAGRMSSNWSAKREAKVKQKFDAVSASNMLAKANGYRQKVAETVNQTLPKIGLYQLWATNIEKAVTFYDDVRTKMFNNGDVDAGGGGG